MQGREDVWEMTWAPDGGATFHFGNPVAEGEALPDGTVIVAVALHIAPGAAGQWRGRPRRRR
jgi:hypothetical protein